MTAGQTFRVGLAGAGYVSEFHVRALLRLPNVRIVGVTDLDQERARGAAERFGIAVFPSLKAMAADGLDVVHVLTPPSSHAAVALEAMGLGCHVLVEKPLATSVEECDRLAAEGRARGLKLCVNHSLLLDPLVLRALAGVRRGDVGEVLTVDIFRSSNYPPYRGGPLPPQYREGGYPFRDLGVHALYLLQQFLGPIQNVGAEFCNSGARASDPNLHFDEWRAMVRCERGTGQVQLSWNVKPLQHVLVVQGTRGTLRADLFSMFLTRRRHTPLPKAIERVGNAMAESSSAAMQVFLGAARFVLGRVVPYQGLHNLVRAFYEALASNEPMPVSLYEAREVVRWTEQVAREADRAKQEHLAKFKPSGRPAVVVTGANGHLGRALVGRLLKEGERVRMFVRRAPSMETFNHPQAEAVLGDLGDPAAVDAAIAGARTVFHLGAAMSGGWAAHECGTIAGTRNVVAACLKHGVPKFVYASSLSVLNWAGHPAREAANETAALEPSPKDRGSYTQAKLEAERIVQAAVATDNLPAVIVRPGQIWSETAPLLTPAVGIRIGKQLIMIGNGSSRLPLVHVDDVVEALLLAARSKHAGGEVFHVVDSDLMSREELVSRYRESREPGLRVRRMPLWLACAGAKVVELLARVLHRPAPLSPYRLRSAVASLEFDCAKARAELDWQPRKGSGAALRSLLSPKSA